MTTASRVQVSNVSEDGLLEGMAKLGFEFPLLRQMSINVSGKGPYATLTDWRPLGEPYKAKWVASRYDAEGNETHRFIVLR